LWVVEKQPAKKWCGTEILGEYLGYVKKRGTLKRGGLYGASYYLPRLRARSALIL